jgi:hypothetical protein
MIVKKLFASTLAVLVTAGSLGAAEQQSNRPNNPQRRPKMTPPVYAPAPEKEFVPGKMTPEQRALREAARRRRIEIMVLLTASKIMPEKDRPAIHAQLLKLIDADFQAMVEAQKVRIAQAEKDLERFRKDLADREKNREKLIKQEFDRLVNMPVPWQNKQPAQK